MNIFPKQFRRISDGMIFELNKDGLTYSLKKSKEEFPDNLHHEWPYELLEGRKEAFEPLYTQGQLWLIEHNRLKASLNEHMAICGHWEIKDTWSVPNSYPEFPDKQKGECAFCGKILNL